MSQEQTDRDMVHWSWEYNVLSWTYDPEQGLAKLNALGAEGWELIAIDRGEWYIFKRPKIDL